MKHGIIILLLFTSISIFSQRIEDVEGSFSLDISMEPSFIENANFAIEYNIFDDSHIQIKNSYFDKKQILDRKSLEALKGFLESYKFDKTSNVQTETIVKDGDTSTITILGFDGITVSGTFTELNDYKEFEFWSPERNTDDYKLIELLFSITDQYFTEERERRYLNSLKGYFKDLSQPCFQDSSHIEFMIRKDVYMVVEKMPEFKGGKDSLNTYVNRQLKENLIINSLPVSGKVYIEFVIDEKGQVFNVEVLKGLESVVDGECKKIIANMPDWIPGEQYGNKVKVSYRLPMRINDRSGN